MAPTTPYAINAERPGKLLENAYYVQMSSGDLGEVPRPLEKDLKRRRE